MFIIKTCLSPTYRKGGLKNLHYVPKSTPQDTNQIPPIIYL